MRITKTSKLIRKEKKVDELKEKREEDLEELEDDKDEDFRDIRKLMLKKTQIVVRIYIVCCQNLVQKDLTSQSDPYLKIKLGGTVVKDDKNFIKDDSNPRFL